MAFRLRFSPQVASGPKKILLVEDNADLRGLLAIIVSRLGHEVIVASDGQEALERTSAKLPDLILMDIGLPKLNGAEAIVRIKGDPETKHIPIVILSALSMCTNIKRALEAGAAEVVQKPVSVLKVQQIVSKHLGIRAGVSTPVRFSRQAMSLVK